MVRPDSLIFDMDGTLWDAVETYAQGFNDFFEHHGVSRRIEKAGITGFMGMEEAAFLAATLPEWPAETRSSMYKEVVEHQYARIRRDGGDLYEGVVEGLAELSRHFGLFIVSNCPALAIEHFMDWAGIRPYIIDSKAHGANGRPKYQNIRDLIASYSLAKPVYIGDTDSDRKQAELVPLPFFFVDYGFGQSTEYAGRASSFRQLVETMLDLSE